MSEHPMETYQKSALTLAERQEWAQAIEGWAADELADFAIDLLGLTLDKVWPFEDIGVDPTDWVGTSIEFYRSSPEMALTDEQVEKIEKAGFDIARVMFKDGSPRKDYPTPHLVERWKEFAKQNTEQQRPDAIF